MKFNNFLFLFKKLNQPTTNKNILLTISIYIDLNKLDNHDHNYDYRKRLFILIYI